MIKLNSFLARPFLFFSFLPSVFASDHFDAEQSCYQHWSGKDYTENAILQEKWAKSFLFDSYDFSGTEKILDIGCGDGRITADLAKKAYNGNVIGIDQSLKMIESASFLHSSIRNLSFLKRKAQDLSFYSTKKSSFDLITSFTALHWVKEQREVLKGVYKALKPNGKLYFRLCSDSSDPIYELATNFSFHEKYKDDFKSFSDPLYRFSVSQYKKFLDELGFNIISLKDVEDRDIIQDITSLKKQVKSYLPHYHFLRDNASLEKAEQFIDDIVLSYEKSAPRSYGRVILVDHYLEIIANK